MSLVGIGSIAARSPQVLATPVDVWFSEQMRGLVIDGVCAPERAEFAEQIAAFIGEFRGAEQIERNRRGLARIFQHLLSPIFVDGEVPGIIFSTTSPFEHLHRVFSMRRSRPCTSFRATEAPLAASSRELDRPCPRPRLPCQHQTPRSALFGNHGVQPTDTMRTDVLF